MNTLGIDIGGTEIKVGLVDERGHLLESARGASDRENLSTLLATITALVESVSGPDANPGAIGVGVPGLVSPESGRVEFAPNMPALKRAEISELLSEHTGLGVLVRNDADMNAWGEFIVGAGAGTTHMVCLTIGTGLGSGVIVDGQLYAGPNGYGAEAGHMVIDPEGRPCSCGGRGCLETVVSATRIVALTGERIEAGTPTTLDNEDEELTARRIQEAAEQGDALAKSVYAEIGRSLGIACGSLINLLGPDMIVIGGGVSAAGDLLLEPALAEARTRAYPQMFKACRILPARLGSDAGVVGAALLAGSRLHH